jgi:predicted nucleotidyltransferase
LTFSSFAFSSHPWYNYPVEARLALRISQASCPSFLPEDYLGDAMARISAPLLGEITHRLVDEFQPEEIILFGSQAWGKPGEDSDLDLLVIISHSDLSPARRAMSAHQCLQGLNVPKDILVRTRAEVERFRHVQASLEHQIFERGIVLYDRQAGTSAELAYQGTA